MLEMTEASTITLCKMMSNEVWKEIPGYNGRYQISNFGRVRSFSKWKNGGLLKPGKCGNPGPYLWVNLVYEKDRIKKNCYIHRLVAENFLDSVEGKTEVNHIDGNTLNNRADNLEWCTHGENMKHASLSGALSKGQDPYKGEKNPRSKAVLQYDLNGNFIREWGSVNQVMRETGIPADRIFRCCNPQKYPHEKTAKGFIWVYKNGQTDNQNPTA